ncbi:MAG TPA: sulfurtransferase TusA family protein [Kineosporiaceae bacterium]|nr:sulfurtransferase TusA family protein [Kineosporiaceae bacterium]
MTAYLVDGGPLQCARLLILLQRHVRSLAPGTLVHVRTHDPIAGIDLPAWCHMTGHRWLGIVPDDTGEAAATYAIQVAASAVPTHPERPWRLQPADDQITPTAATADPPKGALPDPHL